MTSKERAWLKLPDIDEGAYSLCDIGLKDRTRIRRRFRWFNWFAGLTILAAVACCLYEKFGR